jgi:hypothetical protein
MGPRHLLGEVWENPLKDYYYYNIYNIYNIYI